VNGLSGGILFAPLPVIHYSSFPLPYPMKSKVVLAFSGGLDTSYCVKYLSEDRGLEVHSVLVDTGGFSADEVRAIEQRAWSLGVPTT
jgi:argininosuccinate synthase